MCIVHVTISHVVMPWVAISVPVSVPVCMDNNAKVYPILECAIRMSARGVAWLMQAPEQDYVYA